MLYFSTILLSVFITISLIPMLTRLAGRFQMVDLPDPRKVHTRPIPRIGGFAMALGAFFPIVLWTAVDDFVRAYLAGAGILVIFGLLDDMKGLGYRVKFAAQIIAGMIVVFFGGVRIESLGTLLPGMLQIPEWFSFLLSVVAIVGVTNAINLADGLDGLAGGISLLCFCCIGYLAYLDENTVVMLLSLSLAGAIFGFLRYNTHPASLFMGDTGSQLLGFSAIVLTLKITQGDTPFSPVLPLIVLGFPVLDTLTVMVERIRKGRSPFSPDKNHFHHRLIHLGLSHADAVFSIYLIQAVMVVSAIIFKYHNDWLLLAFYVSFSVLVIIAFTAADRNGFRFKHFPSILDLFSGRLRNIKDLHLIIKVSFHVSKVIVPLLFLISCLFPARIPLYFSIIAGCFACLIVGVRIFGKSRMGFCLRFVLFLTIPLILYLVKQEKAFWVSPQLVNLYHISFGITAFFIILVTKYSRRLQGFRMTTMDFLIVFIGVVIPNLPDHSIQSHQLGLLTVQIVVLLFGYEVLIKELRGRFNSLTASTLISLGLISIRGFLF